jgi:hypothetical protein
MEVQTMIIPLLKQVVETIAAECFTDGYRASVEECLGLALSKYLEWDGVKLMQVASFALEDANYHTEAGLMHSLAECNQVLMARRGKGQGAH